MTKYTQNENFTIWHDKDTMKFFIQVEGEKISDPYSKAVEAIESYYDI